MFPGAERAGSNDRGMAWAGLDPQYPRAIDSVLIQGTAAQPTCFYAPNGVQVPAIIHPFYQPSIGPTASNREGPYGPYWPDGVFIPYRPAALRDPRYHHVPTTTTSTTSTTTPPPRWDGAHAFVQMPTPNHLGSWTPLSTGLAGATNAAPGSVPLHTPPTVNAPPGIRSYGVHWAPSQAEYHSRPVPFQPGDAHPIAAFPVNVVPTQNPYPSYPMLHHSNHVADMAGVPEPPPGASSKDMFPSDLSSVSSAYSVEPAARGSRQSQFKDRLLAWAHRIYVDLLTTLHQTRMGVEALSSQGGHPHLKLPKPTIYPKPPRQRTFQFSGPAREVLPGPEGPMARAQAHGAGAGVGMQAPSLQKPALYQTKSDPQASGRYHLTAPRGSSATRLSLDVAPATLERHHSADLMVERRPQLHLSPLSRPDNAHALQQSPGKSSPPPPPPPPPPVPRGYLPYSRLAFYSSLFSYSSLVSSFGEFPRLIVPPPPPPFFFLLLFLLLSITTNDDGNVNSERGSNGAGDDQQIVCRERLGLD